MTPPNPTEFDFWALDEYGRVVKNGTIQKKTARPGDIVRLARKTKWNDIKLSSGEVVTAETTRHIFEDAVKALKSKSRRRRAHVTVS